MTVPARNVAGMWIRRKRGLEGDMGVDNECAWNLLSWGGVYLPKWSVWGQ